MPTNQPLLPVNDAESPFFWGIDVGGTNIKIGLVDNRGRTIAFDSIATQEEDGPRQAVERVADQCQKLAQAVGLGIDDLARAGLGTPGTMCLKRGMLLEPPNLPNWSQFPIQQVTADALGMPVSFVNDANAAAFGEYWVGTGKEYEALALLTLGTGVGGGFIVNGQLVNGVNSFGSEVGHMVVDSRPDARLCVWGGGQGHLEAYASASGVAARAEEGLRAGVVSGLNRVLMAGKAVTAKRVYDAAVLGDEFSLNIIDETAFYLGVGIASVVHAVDPGLVVLGGAMNFGGRTCEVGQRFLAGIREEFRKRTFPNVFDGTQIDFASLGSDAGYIGAAGIAHQDFHAQQQEDQQTDNATLK